nr:MAG TPA: hypothetical protein [Caudoviricetes sp.]
MGRGTFGGSTPMGGLNRVALLWIKANRKSKH